MEVDPVQPAKAYLLVRARVVAPADRADFDRWYEEEHLPDARAGLRAEKAWRFWSRTDPAIHYAAYQFSNVDYLNERMASTELKALLKEFDTRWPHVHRTREILELQQQFPQAE